MSRKKIFQLISLGFLLAGVALSIPGTNWRDSHALLAFSSLLLGTLGSIISIFIPSRYVFAFGPNDWIDSDGGTRHLFIQSSKHGQGKTPQVQVFAGSNGVYAEVEADVGHDANGSIVFHAPNTAQYRSRN